MSDLLVLKGNDVYNAFMTGAKNLIHIKTHLNKINVFPVPDGDTGSNMAYLMQTILDQAKPNDDLSVTMDSIAYAAMNGSRGNSGIIFSEYLNGLAEKLKGKASAKIEEFHEAVIHAIQKAYHAIMNPVEGTILTVLRKAFNHHDFKDVKSYFETSLTLAKSSLLETPNELPILKESGVVDAGAEGFTAFLEGVTQYLQTGKTEFTYQEITQDEAFAVVHEMVIEERFCTEAQLKDVKISNESMISLLSKDGSSLIVSGDQNNMRIHIHTNQPDVFFLKLRNVATVTNQKVDDMLRQKQAIEDITHKIAVVTDSIADIPLSLKDKYHIHMIPVYLMVDDYSYLDQISVTTRTFYHMISQAKHFSSSQPDKITIERMMDFLLEHYEQILFVSVASKLSGTYNAINQYAEKHPQVTVFDSKLNSGAEGQLVLNAAMMAQEDMPLEEIISTLEDQRKRTKIYVSVNTLKYMVKQGRVSKVTGLAAKIMNLKPVISLDKDGGGTIEAKALSLRSNEKKILELLSKGEIESYAVVHAMAEDRCLKLADRIEKMTGKKPEYMTEIGPVLSMNAGLGAVAVSVLFKEEV
ncbi:MAG: DegV family EDD domain-containing protein [Firmicutes bacterium]|nr:DegV family EDD domain-containing protein [Bacillota bacterium]